MSFDSKRLVTRMLSVEPDKRPTPTEVLKDPWFATISSNVPVNVPS